jgi:hypothetical protein
MLRIVFDGTVPAKGGSVSVALPETLDQLTLVLGTPGATAQLETEAVAALHALLGDALARMRAG